MDQHTLLDYPLLTCKQCGHLDHTDLSNIGHNGLCSLCDKSIGKWHGEFARKLPAAEESPISDKVVDAVLAELTEYSDPVDPKQCH